MEIRLNKIRPLPLAGARADAGSGVWDQELRIAPGDSILVRAQSGQGKTTLLAILYGLRQDYQGQVRFNDRDIRQLSRREWSRLRQTALSIVFQDLQLFDHLTARQNADLKNRLTAHKTPSQIDHLFATLGLAAKQQEPVTRLSLGQRQRVAIIRALCQPFRFLLLDEPFSHLDEENRGQAKALISEACQQQQAGLIFTSLKLEPDLGCHTVLTL